MRTDIRPNQGHYPAEKYREHLGGSDGLAMILGGWLMCSSFLLFGGPITHYNDMIVGALVLCAIFYRLLVPRTKHGWNPVVSLLGLWLVIGSFILGYSNIRVHGSDLICGFVLILCGLTQRGGEEVLLASRRARIARRVEVVQARRSV